MDFNSIINDAENAAGTNAAQDAMKNIDVAGFLNSFIAQHGLNISQANVNGMLNSPQFKQSLMNAVKSYATTKISGAGQNTVEGHLGLVADHIMQKIPGAAISKQMLVNNLLGHIANNVKL